MWFVATTFGAALSVNAHYVVPDAFRPTEFVERLKRPDSVGAVLHPRCSTSNTHAQATTLRSRCARTGSIASIPSRTLRTGSWSEGETPR
jgi:hypothetical protein